MQQQYQVNKIIFLKLDIIYILVKEELFNPTHLFSRVHMLAEIPKIWGGNL